MGSNIKFFDDEDDPDQFIKYTEQGKAVMPIREVAGEGYLVARVLSREYDEEDAIGPGVYWDENETFLVKELFAHAPREYQDQTIIELNARIAELSAKAAEIREQTSEMEHADRDRRAKWAQHQELVHLDKFLEGDFKYFVTHVWSSWTAPEVVEINGESIPEAQRYYLLRLKWQEDGRVRGQGRFYWTAENSRGYGDNSEVAIARTIEEAQEIARKHIEWAMKQTNHTPAQSFIDAAVLYGATLPEGYAEKVRASAVERADKAVTDARATLSRAEASRNELN